MDKIDNIYARVLIFYEKYQKNKLNEIDLMKIMKKYKNKSIDLLNDLTKKYDYYTIPQFVSKYELIRIINNYTIPKLYLDQLPLKDNHPKYDKRLDVLSDQFDAEYALSTKYIITADVTVPPFDNLSKVTHLIPGLEVINKPILYAPGEAVVSSSSNSSNRKNEEDTQHPLDLIAELTVGKVTWKDEWGKKHTVDSPLILLKKFMEQKQRVRIIIRRKTW
jgi:hypothetical protein